MIGVLRDDFEQKVINGYERIAFGSIKDSIKLLFTQELNTRALGHMDLFSISEIKRPKGGGMEIKFFDRIKALQCLQEIENKSEGTESLYKVIEESARALKEDCK